MTDSAETYPIEIRLAGHRNNSLNSLCQITQAQTTGRVESISKTGEKEWCLVTDNVDAHKLGELSKKIASSITQSSEQYNIKDMTIKALDSASITFTFPKDEYDSDIFVMYYPADGLNIRIFDNTGKHLTVGATSIHPKPLVEQPRGRSAPNYHYQLPHYLLPFQGFKVWWSQSDLKVPPSSQ